LPSPPRFEFQSITNKFITTRASIQQGAKNQKFESRVPEGTSERIALLIEFANGLVGQYLQTTASVSSPKIKSKTAPGYGGRCPSRKFINVGADYRRSVWGIRWDFARIDSSGG
jgi:hypothetical protein